MSFLSVGHQSKKTIAYALVSLFVGASVALANGFLASVDQGVVDAWPILSAFEGDYSLAYGLLVAGSAFLMCCALEHSLSRKGRTSPRALSGVAEAIILAAVLLLAWAPVIAAFYPGILYHDTVFQLAQFFGSESLDVYTGSPSGDAPKITDHHPIMTTLLFSFFAWIGQLGGSAYNGLFLCVFIQSCALAVSISCGIVYARRRLLLRPLLCIFLILFCALFPLFPIYAASLSKDIVFAPLFAAFFIVFVEIVRTRGSCLEKKGWVLSFVLLSLGLAMTKKIGVYLVIACAVVAFAYCREKRLVIVSGGILCCVTIFVVIPSVAYPLLDAGPGSSKEMLSVMYEQTALYAKDHPEDIMQDERLILDESLGFETLADRYRPDTADYVKNFAPSTIDTMSYLEVWAKQGLRHPLSYARAFLSLEAGFVGTGDAYLPLFETVFYDRLDSIDEDGVLDVYPDVVAGRSEIALTIENAISEVSTLPVIGIFFTRSLYAFALPIIVVAIVVMNRRKELLLLTPYVMFAAMLFLSPVSTGVNAGRYVFPLVCSVPLLLGLASSSLVSSGELEARTDIRSGAANIAEAM